MKRMAPRAQKSGRGSAPDRNIRQFKSKRSCPSLGVGGEQLNFNAFLKPDSSDLVHDHFDFDVRDVRRACELQVQPRAGVVGLTRPGPLKVAVGNRGEKDGQENHNGHEASFPAKQCRR